ncbi:hypothetical protein JCM10908_003402 [Rhodotorula pacifica]|uniref:uncharacterized protein n=1 Tax=Rhodotorula pacifica TaxID=1495444 RepID=UPI003172CDBD
MPPKSASRRRPRDASSANTAGRAAKRLADIDRAFDTAAVSPRQSTTDATPRRRQRAARVVPDDEEQDDDNDQDDDDDEMMMEAVEIAGQPAPDVGGGGFLPEPAAAEENGGGFMLDDDSAHMGGGFLPEPTPAADASGGGFLPYDAGGDYDGGGGFLPEPSEAGGFFPDHDAGDTSAGGFLPVPESMTAAEATAMQQDLDFASAGGFLPLPDVPAGFLPDDAPSRPKEDDLLPLPDPNAPSPPDRIALTSIPAALRSLGLHRVGLQGAELMALFEEVASDDEDAEGGRSVQRERFREACRALLGSDDEEEDEEEDERDEYREDALSADEDLQGAGRRRLRRGANVKAEQPTRVQPSRRSTRANPIKDEEAATPMATEKAALNALPDDFEDEEEESSFASGSEGEGGFSQSGKPNSKKVSRQKKGRKGGRRSIDPSQPLSAKDLAAASDTFDLFFEESPQLPFPQKDRQISLLELQRACRVLKEKMTDGDLNEMLEYAARSKGSVNLEAFARILLETGL